MKNEPEFLQQTERFLKKICKSQDLKYEITPDKIGIWKSGNKKDGWSQLIPVLYQEYLDYGPMDHPVYRFTVDMVSKATLEMYQKQQLKDKEKGVGQLEIHQPDPNIIF